MRISDWSSDVCSSDLWFAVDVSGETVSRTAAGQWREGAALNLERALKLGDEMGGHIVTGHVDGVAAVIEVRGEGDRSEEHTSELQSLMRSSYAAFCLKIKTRLVNAPMHVQ